MRVRSYAKPHPRCTCEHEDVGVGVPMRVAEDPYRVQHVEKHEPPYVGGSPSKILVAGDTHGDANHAAERWFDLEV